ncbi:MAG: DNRLRE domain-containing protein [bacterium]
MRICLNLFAIFTFLFYSFLKLDAQTLFINEILAGNTSVNADLDGFFEDWLEIYNAGSQAVDLKGYTVTDDPANPALWTFPAATIQPGEFLLVWASSKNLTAGELHTNFKLSKGGESLSLFDPSGGVVDQLTFGVQSDDVSLARSPDGSGGFVATTTPTPGAANVITGSAQSQPKIVINEFLAVNSNTNQDGDGASSDWIELYNADSKAVNLRGYSLTDKSSLPDQWTFPSVMLQPGDFLLVWASGKDRAGNELHTNFGLSGAGEFVGLYSPEGFAVDGIDYGIQSTDVSIARNPDGSGDFKATSNPTPARSNRAGTPPSGVLSFSPGSGFFNNSVRVSLSSNVGGAIHYTLDGSPVNVSSRRYSGPLTLSSTRVLRARVFKGGTAQSEDVSRIYLIDYEGHLPVLSLATEGKNLYGTKGIFDHPKKRGRAWEREVSVNFLELDGSGFQINSGVRVHGQHSRGRTADEYPKKSMRLYFRSDYGESKLRYRMFKQKKIASFDRLLIHSGGSFDQFFENNKWTLTREPLNHELLHEQGGAVSVSRPVLVYINGDVWGIYQIRERIDEDYIRTNFGIADVDLIDWHHKAVPDVSAGDLKEWNQTYNFFQTNNLRSNSKYEEAKRRIDIDNFIDYHIIEIYVGNKDWPHNNNFFFRERSPTGKWRWILWDSESSYRNPNIKLLEWATRDRPRNDISSSDSERQLFGTLFLRKLIENEDFKERFVNRFADLLNTTLSPDHIRQVFDRMTAVIEPDIPIEAKRWNSSVSEWYAGIQQVHAFIKDRSRIQRNQLRSFFRLSGEAELTVNASPAGAGNIRVNTLIHSELPWTGVYFHGNPVTLEAIANPGFRFSGWSGASPANNAIVRLNPSGSKTVIAKFTSSGPFLRVLSPNGGEVFTAGQTHTITWTSEQAGANVRIEFSTNNGASWTTIVSGTANDGSHSWLIPDTPAAQCLVKVSSAGSGNPLDASDSVFTIRTPGPTTPPPSVGSFNPVNGPVGVQVTINGTNLSSASSVTFNRAPASSFTVDSDTQIRASVPNGAATGKITVVTPQGSAESGSDFVVTTNGGASQAVTLEPTDDTFVWKKRPTQINGDKEELRVRKTSKSQYAFLKFNVTGISGNIVSAKLRVHFINGSDDGGAVYSVSNTFKGSTTPWNEREMNWNNAPDIAGLALSSVGAVNTGNSVEFDVSTALSGNGTFSFVFRNKSSDAAIFSSKEGVQAPQLIIELDSGASPALPPVIASFSPKSGAAGTQVTINGTNLSSASSVTFNRAPASSFTVDSDTQIRASVPNGAATGKITVVTPQGSAESGSDFVVTTNGGASQAVTLEPTDDTFVWKKRPTQINGDKEELRVRKTSKSQYAFLKFNVTGISGNIVSAKLRVHFINGSDDGGAVYSVSNTFKGSTTPWNEREMNWNNAPDIAGLALSSVGAVNTGNSVEFDVSTALSGNGTFSFVFRNKSSDAAIFSSKEGVQAPQLIIELDSGASPAVPAVTAFTPKSGLPGSQVTITGVDFSGTTVVQFNGESAAFSVVSNTQINATVPNAATSGVISVTTPAGTATSATDFTVEPSPAAPPVIASFSPNSGAVGMQVTLSGSHFDGTTAVTFNAVAATIFSVQSGSTLLATVPNAATSGAISVTTPAGTATSAVDFTVEAPPALPPVIASFSPNSGAVGMQVTLSGSHFNGASEVTFSHVSAVFAVKSDSEISATVPGGATTGPISVTNAAGTVSSIQDFTVSAPASSLTLIPTDDAYVRSNRPDRNYGNNSQLTVRKSRANYFAYFKFAVSGIAGAVQNAKIRLTVTNNSADGGALFSVSNNYNDNSGIWREGGLIWDNAPVVAGAPLSVLGPVAIGEIVEFDVTAEIHGNGFYSFALKNNSGDAVRYSSKEGTSPPELSIDLLTTTSPVIASFSPISGVPGSEVTLTGNNLAGTTSVSFNGTPASSFQLISDAEIRAFVPAGAATGKISVTTLGGTVSSADDFTVTASTPQKPEIASFSPKQGQTGAQVTILGVHLSGTTDVLFNGTSASFSVESDSEILAQVPDGASTGTLSVVTPDGTALSLEDFIVETGGGSGPQTLIFQPTDDSFARSSKPSKNYGGSASLRVRKTRSAQYMTFLKFSISGLNGRVVSAKLRLYVEDPGPDGGAIYPSETAWDENSVNWSVAPQSSGAALAFLGAVSQGQIAEFDVTPAVLKNGDYSFIIKNRSKDLAMYSSKEGVVAPELEVKTDGTQVSAKSASSSKDVNGLAFEPSPHNVPDEFALELNYPNPFNIETVISYRLPEAVKVRIAIYNLRGQVVRELANEFQQAGFRKVRWNGRNELGNEVSSGAYFVRLVAGEYGFTRQMTLQK